jgi:NTP pyrophosphatase (non-canonical NTP hydrolase)
MEIKPCPFCGGYVVAYKHRNKYLDWWECRCTNCRVEQTTRYDYQFEAVEAWNRRYADDRPEIPREEIEAIRDDSGMPLITSEKMETISEAIAYYGESKQIDMAIEEMSELIKALCKSKRASAGDARQAAQANTAEEIADVFIMLVQMVKIFGCADEVQNTVDQKIDRLKKRMQEQKEAGTDEANKQNRKADC